MDGTWFFWFVPESTAGDALIGGGSWMTSEAVQTNDSTKSLLQVDDMAFDFLLKSWSAINNGDLGDEGVDFRFTMVVVVVDLLFPCSELHSNLYL